jgi:hypothetical protein
LGDVHLAIGILDELFWLRFSISFSSHRKHHFHEKVEKIIEDEKEDEE